MPYPYTLWSIWPQLPLLHKLYFLILAVVTIYDFVLAGRILKGLQSTRKLTQSGDGARDSVGVLRHRCTPSFVLHLLPWFVSGRVERLVAASTERMTDSLTIDGTQALRWVLRKRRQTPSSGTQLTSYTNSCTS